METRPPKAAVALIKTQDPDPEYLIIERAQNPQDPWSGQLALPGGHRDEKDTSLLDTGIRETLEETGVRLNRAFLAKELAVHSAGRSNQKIVAVAPFLFTLPARVPTQVDPLEVSSIFWVRQSHLLDEKKRDTLTLNINHEDRSFPAINIEDKLLWGFTYHVLRTHLIEEGHPFDSPF